MAAQVTAAPLTDQTQQVHRHRRQCTHQVVGVKVARGQQREVHVGLEHRVKLLVRAVVGLQGQDALGRERLGQSARPALQHILGQQHLLVAPVDDALAQAVHPPRSQDMTLVLDLNRLAPDTLALALAQHRPPGIGIGHLGPGDRLHRCAAWVHLKMKAILRSRALACWSMAHMSLVDSKPESARVSKGSGVSRATSGNTRSKLYSVSQGECCVPGRKASSRQ